MPNLRLKFCGFIQFGASKGIRTPDPRLRRAMLYPAELLTHIGQIALRINGAGEGNRTLVTSLEG